MNTPIDTADNAEHRSPGQRIWSVVRLLALVLLVVAVIAGGFFMGGFLRFASSISGAQAPADVQADAIVVLTGGSARIAAAIDLLSKSHARRLLISGVHPQTTAKQIAKLNKRHEKLFACCVDLDRKAENTIGNASETAKWVTSNHYTSLIVVTSAYHMPRSLEELAGVLPNVRLVAYPVVVQKLGMGKWYRHVPAARLLLAEYLKYIATRFRMAMRKTGRVDRSTATATHR